MILLGNGSETVQQELRLIWKLIPPFSVSTREDLESTSHVHSILLPPQGSPRILISDEENAAQGDQCLTRTQGTQPLEISYKQLAAVLLVMRWQRTGASPQVPRRLLKAAAQRPVYSVAR